MHKHRFREFVEVPAPAEAFSGANGSAFVSLPIEALVPPNHQAHLVAIYQAAAVRTKEQLARRRPYRLPQFSVN
jgi:hypothetical protein